VVRAEVSEIDVGHVRVGDTAEVRLVGGARRAGKVRWLSRDASPGTRTYPIEIVLPNPDHAIPAGMTTEVTLYTAPVPAVAVPRSVITLSAAGELGLRIVGPDDVAHFAAVELIDDTPEGLILAGVPADARIIVAGQDLVRDGEKVNVVEGMPARPAGAAQ
jgi:multidrug efflux system membrane fusion protein